MGAYANSVLASDEQVVYETKLHTIIFVGPIVVSLFLMLFFIGSLLSGDLGASLFFLVLAVLPLVLATLAYVGSEFVVTNKRLITKTGVISRSSSDMNFNKIEGLSVDQGIFGRMLGFGSVGVRGTGGFVQSFPRIDKPFQLKRAVDDAMAAMKK